MTRPGRSTIALCLITTCIFPNHLALASETFDYCYDASGRMTKVTRETAQQTVRSCYTYDKAGNRTNVSVTTLDCGISSGLTLLAGQSIWSEDGRFQLIMQTDGNLVLYGPDGYIWHAPTHGGSDRRMVMQSDGNLVVYNSANQALWHAGTGGHPGARLWLQNNGKLLVVSSCNTVLWASGTA